MEFQNLVFMQDEAYRLNPQFWLDQAISVYALALVQGVRPTRRWLVYAHSPLEDRGRVEIAIPEYGPVVVPVSRGGSFHRVEEQTRSVAPLR